MRAYLLLGIAGVVSSIHGFSSPVLAQGGDQGPEAEVRKVAEVFLSALSEADTASLSRLLAPRAMIYSVREGDGGSVIRSVSSEAFLTSLGGEDQVLLERMWNPTVLVQDRVAMVWTPYDFHLNGAFSHCGIDVFSMLKGEEGWKVTSITYNVVREGCDPSPLGPPRSHRFRE